MAKVALVNPQITTSTWLARFGNLDNTCIRHSLAYLSSPLKAAGHEVVLVDLRFLSGWEAYEELLAAERPDFVGVTMHTCEHEAALECCRRAKYVVPGARTVVGGIQATMYPQVYLKSGVVNYVVKGEGEVSFPKLVSSPDTFPREVWGETPDLDALPFEDRTLWSDYEQRIQVPMPGFPLEPPVMDMLAQRGCPWQCRFCCGPGEQNLYTKDHNGRRVAAIRGRSVTHVIEELRLLYNRYRFRSIIFHDDQFIIKPQWTEDFCRGMLDAGFAQAGVRWWAAVRADVICRNERLIALMREAGCEMISIGFESFSDPMLRWIKKATTYADNMKAAEICERLGIKIYANFILGIPYEDGHWHAEYDIETVRGIVKIRPYTISPSFFSPIPGTFLHEFCVKNQLIADDDLAALGQRFPDRAKIKGVDYDFLNQLLEVTRMVNQLYPKNVAYYAR